MTKYIIENRLSVVYVAIPSQENQCLNTKIHHHVKQWQMFVNTILNCWMINIKMIYIVWVNQIKRNNAM